MSPESLYTRFANSEYGQLLESRTRFDDFKPDWVGTELWCGLLGDDVNNLRHMSFTHDLAKRFTDLSEMDGPPRERLLNTAITHDWGEAIIGDIALPSKTSADDVREEFAYRRIGKELLGNNAGRLAMQVIPVLFKKNVPEADMFRSIEYVGYMSTAFKAGRMALGLAHDIVDVELPRVERQELSGALHSLHRAVEIYNLPIAKDYRKKYPAIRTMLDEVL
jgi:hypothetical protein